VWIIKHLWALGLCVDFEDMTWVSLPRAKSRLSFSMLQDLIGLEGEKNWELLTIFSRCTGAIPATSLVGTSPSVEDLQHLWEFL